jgi:hypothetical protein
LPSRGGSGVGEVFGTDVQFAKDISPTERDPETPSFNANEAKTFFFGGGRNPFFSFSAIDFEFGRRRLCRRHRLPQVFPLFALLLFHFSAAASARIFFSCCKTAKTACTENAHTQSSKKGLAGQESFFLWLPFVTSIFFPFVLTSTRARMQANTCSLCM